MASPAPITVVVLTRDEGRNLEACLRSVAGWTSDLWVIDSGSTDETVAIARRWGAIVLEHPFSTHADQWTWALAQLPAGTDWILALDADQRITAPLRDELVERFAAGLPEEVSGLYLNRRQIFLGRWIRHGGYYPKYLLKLFRRAAVSIDPSDLVDHHFAVRGRPLTCRHDIVEDNRNEASLDVWIARHHRYAVLQARQEWESRDRGAAVPLGALWSHSDERVRWCKQAWRRLPLVARPCGYFFYRYVLRLGFLDGLEGLVFHGFQGFWYRLLVDVALLDLRRARAAEVAGEPAGPAS